MKTMGNVKVTKEIEKVISTKVKLAPEPNRFRIYGTPTARYFTSQSAQVAWEKVREWAIKNHAEAELIKDYFVDGKGQRKMFLLVEITDPVGMAIERIIDESNE